MGQKNMGHADFQRHRHKSHDLGRREVTGGESRARFDNCFQHRLESGLRPELLIKDPHSAGIIAMNFHIVAA